MNSELLIVLIVLAVTFALFLSGRLRLDLVAVLALLALFLSGVIGLEEALAGFSDPVVIMIAGLFVVGGALFRTGVADAIGQRLERLAGSSPAGMVGAIMLVSAGLSAFLSSTGTVAVLIPVVLALARSRRVSPSTLLIPLAFGSLLGGMLTLIGTPPNLIVSAQLEQAGLEPFGFFDFTPVGLVMLAVGVAFMMLLAPVLVPARREPAEPDDGPDWNALAAEYGLDGRLARLRVPLDSALVSESLTSTHVRTRHGVTVLAITSLGERGARSRVADPGSLIREQDELFVTGEKAAIEGLVSHFGLELVEWNPGLPAPIHLVDAVIPPRSRFAGKSLRELRLHSGAGVTVVAHREVGGQCRAPDLDCALKVGDALLLTGRIQPLHRLAEAARDLVLLGGDPMLKHRRRRQAPYALAAMAMMLVLMTLGLVPNVIAVLATAAVMLLARCLTVEEAYRSVNWESVILIAAILPMATALDNSGGMAVAADSLLGLAGGHGPYLLIAAIFLLTSILSQLVSNTATTVLVAPMALHAALAMEISPYPVMMVVAVAASTAFSTPVASPVNTLVLHPGGYRFADYARAGVPLQLLVLIATLAVVPLVFPF